MHHIIGVVPTKDYKLILTFDNGEQRIVDIKPIIAKGGVFEPLNNYAEFKKVRVDKSLGTVVWDDEIDLCPDSLYMKSTPIDKEVV